MPDEAAELLPELAAAAGLEDAPEPEAIAPEYPLEVAPIVGYDGAPKPGLAVCAGG